MRRACRVSYRALVPQRFAMLIVFARDGGGLLAVHAHDVLRVERREVPDSREGAPPNAPKVQRVFVRLASDTQDHRLAASVSVEEVVERVNTEIGRMA